nr:MAG TPA: hypothetical protein [Caudoviricetes sp.]
MINLWKYEYCGNVKIEDMDGNIFVGDAQNVVDSEERSDLERSGDSIVISSGGELVEFYTDEIKNIEKV